MRASPPALATLLFPLTSLLLLVASRSTKINHNCSIDIHVSSSNLPPAATAKCPSPCPSPARRPMEHRRLARLQRSR